VFVAETFRGLWRQLANCMSELAQQQRDQVRVKPCEPYERSPRRRSVRLEFLL
jgi:hypothetical protein